MAINVETLAAAKSYTEETMRGAGAIKGDTGEKGDPGTTYTPVIGTIIMAYNDKNGIKFNSFDSKGNKYGAKLMHTKLTGASIDDLADIASENDGKLPTTINALSIDWNGAEIVSGQQLNTTGEVLSKLKFAI